MNVESAVVRGLKKVQTILAAKDQKAMQAAQAGNLQAGGVSVASPQQPQQLAQAQFIDHGMREGLGPGASAAALATAARASVKTDMDAEAMMARRMNGVFGKLPQPFIPQMTLFNLLEEAKVTAQKAGKTRWFLAVDLTAEATWSQDGLARRRQLDGHRGECEQHWRSREDLQRCNRASTVFLLRAGLGGGLLVLCTGSHPNR